MIIELCLRIIGEFGMPDKLALSVVLPIFKRKGDIMNCGCNKSVKLLEHGINVIIIMVIFRCYFSREHIALSLRKLCELGKTNRLKALCMMQNHA